MAELRLEAKELTGPTRWRWVLTDSGGALIADHHVRLDADCWQYQAFTDLSGYLSRHVAQDRRAPEASRVAGELGAWMGAQVLGPVGAALASAAPATIRVALPASAAWLANRPLELAHANELPLAVQDVTLVIDTGASPGRKAPMGDRLRVLGLFSLPEAGQALNLRRERHELVRLIGRIAANGKAADVQVLQYGVTRGRLRDALNVAEGWDIIHVCGHGAAGELLLETAAGTPDLVTAAELADLLALARERVALVTVSARWPAALTTAEQRHLLGLPILAQLPDAGRAGGSPPAEAGPGTGAAALAARLDCAVLAMRYPVTDDFAIALSAKLYELLAARGQPLPRALAIALKQLAGSSASALPAATPALFGSQAVDLKLAAPARPSARSFAASPGDLKMAGFPPQPDRLVGRTAVMAGASAALAAESGTCGVLLQGMAGSGKTTCALDLAYGHEHAFEQLIWYKAPDEGRNIAGALTDFTLALERYLDGLQLAHLLASAGSLAGFLPRLAELVQRHRLLIVIDNAESLLGDSGQWRDARWGQVLGALTARSGLGRVIVTSRRAPSGLAGLHVETVGALSADEAILLARELPRLRALIDDDLPGTDGETSGGLALGVLTITQGHPKLLELADGQASRPDQLARLIAAGDQAWRERGGVPDGFLAAAGATTGGPLAGGTTAPAADYWHLLTTWTRLTAATLSPAERDLFWFLCCLEEGDRQWAVLNDSWAGLRNRLGRSGGSPYIDQPLAVIASRGMITIHDATDDVDEWYAVHPAIAEAGRGHAGQPFQDAVDAVAGGFWVAVHRHASGGPGAAGTDSGLVVRAGLAAVPYLLRQRHWDQAAYLLQVAFDREPSRANAAAMLPAIEQVTRHQPRWAITLARLLTVTDPAAASATLRSAMADAAARGDYEDAAIAAGRLLGLCLGDGRLAGALDLAGQLAGYTQQAGLGPWTQLSDEVARLQVLQAMGHADEVMEEVGRLRDQMATLPASPGFNEIIPPSDVRETLLGTGRQAAALLGRHADALALNADLVASLLDRRAPATEIARARFNDYEPLLRLGRSGESLEVLHECRQVFQDARDAGMLGKTLNALADAEDAGGHGDAAASPAQGDHA